MCEGGTFATGCCSTGFAVEGSGSNDKVTDRGKIVGDGLETQESPGCHSSCK